LAVAMLGLVEAVSISRSVASKSQQRIDGNQEFIGQGMANIVGSFVSAYASSGSFTRTGVNYEAGARTPMAALCAAVSLALILLLIAPLTAYLPIASMAGVLLLVAYNLIDFHHIKEIIHASRAEAAVLATTFFATLFLELEFAIYVGVMLSLTLYLSRTSRPNITTLAPDPSEVKRPLTDVKVKALPQCPQVRVVRLDGSLFFGAVNHVAGVFQTATEQNPDQKNVLIVGNAINFIDVAGAEWLAQESRRLKSLGGGLYICNLKESVHHFLNRSGLIKLIGAENVFDSKAEAIQHIFIHLDRSRCRSCETPVFQECASISKGPKAA